MSEKRMSEKDFEAMERIFIEQNPELAENATKIRDEIDSFDKDIKALMESKEEGFEAAVLILCQGRNFFARYIGDEEMEIPEFKKEEEVNPLLEKHVAIYIDSKDGVLQKCFQKVLGMSSDLRIEFYDSVKGVIESLLTGKLCGIIGIQMNKEANIERYVRHDLKNREGWGYEKAEAMVLPPCVDLIPPHQLTEILGAIHQMQEGKYFQEEDFYFEDELSDLIGQMQIPNREIQIVIVDDRPEEVQGMTTLLNVWPKVKCEVVIQNQPNLPTLSPSIWLLDEDMPAPARKGSEYAKELEATEALLASTTGGSKPDFTNYHFGGKVGIRKNRSDALGFIKFINKILIDITTKDSTRLELASRKALRHEKAEELIEIALTISPSSVIPIASDIVDEVTAKSCRFLAILRRDHREKFNKLTSQK